MFDDLELPLNASRGFVSISWSSCFFLANKPCVDCNSVQNGADKIVIPSAYIEALQICHKGHLSKGVNIVDFRRTRMNTPPTSHPKLKTILTPSCLESQKWDSIKNHIKRSFVSTLTGGPLGRLPSLTLTTEGSWIGDLWLPVCIS